MDAPRQSTITSPRWPDTTRSRILLLLDRHELTVSELCGHRPAAAVDGQPPPEGAGRRRLDRGARRRHQQPLHDDARRSRSGGAPPLAAGPRAGRAVAGGGAGSAAAAGGAGRAPDQVAGVLLLVGRASGIACATSCSAIAFTSRRWRRCAERLDGRRPRLRHRARSARRSRRSSRA